MTPGDLAKIEEGLQRSTAGCVKNQTETEQRKDILSANAGHATAHFPYFSCEDLDTPFTQNPHL